MKHTDVRPSNLHNWEEIDRSKAACLDVVCNHPEWFGWYLLDGKYYPHRKPSFSEEYKDEFN